MFRVGDTVWVPKPRVGRYGIVRLISGDHIVVELGPHELTSAMVDEVVVPSLAAHWPSEPCVPSR